MECKARTRIFFRHDVPGFLLPGDRFKRNLFVEKPLLPGIVCWTLSWLQVDIVKNEE